MSVGLLLITHPGGADFYRRLLERLLGHLPLPVASFELDFDAGLEDELLRAQPALRAADRGHGVLILTDLYGASPSNLAARLVQLGTPARRVSGLNLPMLMRVCNYADASLDELAGIAHDGGRAGVILDHA